MGCTQRRSSRLAEKAKSRGKGVRRNLSSIENIPGATPTPIPVHLPIQVGGPSYMSDPEVENFVLECVKGSVEAEMKTMFETLEEIEKKAEKLRFIEPEYIQNLVALVDGMMLQRAVDTWAYSKLGKEFRSRVTVSLKTKYQNENLQRTCEDIMDECKAVLEEASEASTYEACLEAIRDCIEEEIGEHNQYNGLTLTPDGFVEVIKAYSKLDPQPLIDRLSFEDSTKVSSKARRGGYPIREGNAWLYRFAIEALHL